MRYFILLNSQGYIYEKVTSDDAPTVEESHEIMEVSADEYEYVRLGWQKRDYGWDNSYLANEVDINGMTPEEISDYNVDPNNLRADELQTFLDNTDFKIIQAMECQLAGTVCPVDVNELHQKRQTWREELSQLKEKKSTKPSQ
jgi:hypothetical protein